MLCETNSCVKLIFFIINFLLCIFGALVCGFSLWANLDNNFGTHLSDFVRQFDNIDKNIINEIAEYQASLWILTVVGALVFLVGFLGCCGAGCTSSVLLTMFIFVITILTIIEISATVFSMSNKIEFLSSIEQVLEKCSSTPELRKNIKPIQNVFHCCGATQSTQKLFIDDGLCGTSPIEYPENCFSRISSMTDSWRESIVVVACVLLAIQFLSILSASFLRRTFNYNQYSQIHS